MDYYSSQISKLIEELSRLPGIGAKSAGRLAFHIINMPKDQVERLASTLVEARNNVKMCIRDSQKSWRKQQDWMGVISDRHFCM